MALTKPPVLPPWAESGDVVQPSNAEIQTGWPLSNVPPSRQRFNWLLNFLMNGVRWLTRRGLPDWAADEIYEIGDRAQGPDGISYVSLTQNTNKTPASNPTDWEQWGLTISQLDARLSARDFKESCRVATTANLAALSGLLTIDGVTLNAGDRVLVKSQSTGSQNGIYVAASGAWTRATDADSGAELSSGALIPVTEGTTNGDILWILSTNDPIVIGTTTLVFASVGNLTDVGTPGTYNSVTTDSKGRVISGSSLAYGRTDQNNTWAKAQRGAITALTDAATIALDLSLSNNFSVTLGGNRTLGNPTNAVPGQSGIIAVTQDGTGSRTLAFGSNYKAVGGIASLPALSTAAGAVDHIAYYVETATRIRLDIGKNVS